MDMETDNHTSQRPGEQGPAGEVSWRRWLKAEGRWVLWAEQAHGGKKCVVDTRSLGTGPSWSLGAGLSPLTSTALKVTHQRPP